MADLEGFDGFVAASSRALLQAALARESVLASLVGLSE
ncbi:MAG: hypothetical protein QOI06_3221 [Nocardioidaceae bacterium]|jgi:hypothetical protein|nr:hypothetical protein [Nocardioidaceae bacterium]